MICSMGAEVEGQRYMGLGVESTEQWLSESEGDMELVQYSGYVLGGWKWEYENKCRSGHNNRSGEVIEGHFYDNQLSSLEYILY